MRKTDFTLPTLDDLFTTQEMRDDAKLERVQNIPLSELHPFKDHPFKVQNNEEMERMIESIRKVGAITPALARPLPDGGYELISGHRRLAACQVLGIETMPVIVREMSDDEAVIAMVDANLQRETILPSEKAFAYKMKLEAIKHQGVASGQLVQKFDVCGAGEGLRGFRPLHLAPAFDHRKLDGVGLFDEQGVFYQGHFHRSAPPFAPMYRLRPFSRCRSSWSR